MFLADNPSEDYYETTRHLRVQTFESLGQESSTHQVLFETGEAGLTQSEAEILSSYLSAIVERSGLR
jgi:hypothetical protein